MRDTAATPPPFIRHERRGLPDFVQPPTVRDEDVIDAGDGASTDTLLSVLTGPPAPIAWRKFGRR